MVGNEDHVGGQVPGQHRALGRPFRVGQQQQHRPAGADPDGTGRVVAVERAVTWRVDDRELDAVPRPAPSRVARLVGAVHAADDPSGTEFLHDFLEPAGVIRVRVADHDGVEGPDAP